MGHCFPTGILAYLKNRNEDPNARLLEQIREDLFDLCEHLQDCRDSGLSHRSDEAVASLLRSSRQTLVLPERDL